jgi:hypothetical protein
MKIPESAASDRVPEASDVVEGPVGSAWLKDPATSGPIGADLGALQPIDVAPGDRTDEGRSIDGRPGPHEHKDRDHTDVDRDPTGPQRGEADG